MITETVSIIALAIYMIMVISFISAITLYIIRRHCLNSVINEAYYLDDFLCRSIRVLKRTEKKFDGFDDADLRKMISRYDCVLDYIERRNNRGVYD
jgi:hypothetical protein